MTAPDTRARLGACRAHASNGLHAPADGTDGLCGPCRDRALRLYESLGRARPDPEPDPVKVKAGRAKGTAVSRAACEANAAAASDKLGRYLELRRDGLTVHEAALRIGVQRKTARRSYEPHWRARCEAPAADAASEGGAQ